MLGAFNVLKPTGLTSFDVVMRVRGILRRHYGVKDIKVGHLGTLDPAGSGVLPIVFGKATKLFDYFTNNIKVYRAKFVFGKTTESLDSFSKVIFSEGKIPHYDEILQILPTFLGEIEQIPPIYSRISINGKRACDMARKGLNVEMPKRFVNIFEINPIEYFQGVLTLDITCSGGTYIRSLCRDLAEKLNTFAYMAVIIRLKCNNFEIINSLTTEELANDIENNLIKIDNILLDLQRVDVLGDEIKKLINGVDIPPRSLKGDYRVYINDKLFGICCDATNALTTKIRLFED